MNAAQLKGLMFPNSTNKEKNGELAQFGKFLEGKGRYKAGAGAQGVYSKFQQKKTPSDDFLRDYAEYRGFKNVEAFLQWAKAPMQTEMYSENTAQSSEPNSGMVNEPPTNYKEGDESVLKQQLIKVFADNVKLHQDLADRGNFIIHLLGK